MFKANFWYTYFFSEAIQWLYHAALIGVGRLNEDETVFYPLEEVCLH